ncbi:hypothetical protein [Komagataeibacter xylinus]|uniref:hypothetical protein n=1 Tax=Komagataeibacter xylinus TaxID=28448 RepID=UPI00280B6D56|nr:hypothetical protein [Komagataeibacter xylinus]
MQINDLGAEINYTPFRTAPVFKPTASDAPTLLNLRPRPYVAFQEADHLVFTRNHATAQTQPITPTAMDAFSLIAAMACHLLIPEPQSLGKRHHPARLISLPWLSWKAN